MVPESILLTQRQLIRVRVRRAHPDIAVDNIAGRRHALRSALVEQRLDLTWIEFRLILLGRRIRFGLGLGFLFRFHFGFLLVGLLLWLLWLGLRHIFLDRLGDRIALRLRLFLLGRWRLRF